MPEISDFLTATSGPFSVSSIDCGAATGPSLLLLEQQQPIVCFFLLPASDGRPASSIDAWASQECWSVHEATKAWVTRPRRCQCFFRQFYLAARVCVKRTAMRTRLHY